MDLLRHFEKEQIKDLRRPKLRAGDIVRVETKIEEESKTRLQTFEGTILMIKGSGPSATFTVRRETNGYGIERIFPLYSPLITKIEIVKRQKTRRAKLGYLRQAGRRRFKEDVKSMQRLIKQAEKEKREIEEARKAAEAEKERQQKEQEKETKAKEAEKQNEESTVTTPPPQDQAKEKTKPEKKE